MAYDKSSGLSGSSGIGGSTSLGGGGGGGGGGRRGSGGSKSRSERDRERRDRDAAARAEAEAAARAEAEAAAAAAAEAAAKARSLGAKYSEDRRRAWAKEHGVGAYGPEVDPLDPASFGPSPEAVDRAFERGVDPRQQQRRDAADQRAEVLSAQVESDVAAKLGEAQLNRPAIGTPRAISRPALGVANVAGPLQTEKQEQLRTLGFFDDVSFADIPDVAEQFGPGEAVFTDTGPQFQPDRSFFGGLRDTVFGYERGISPGVARTARQRGALGALTTGLRRGVVQTGGGVKPETDVVGQLLSAGDLVSSVINFPGSALGAAVQGNPLAIAATATPLIGLGRNIAGIVEESKAIGELRTAGILPEARRQVASPSQPTSASGGGRDVAFGRATPALAQASPAAVQDESYLENLRRRSMRRGFGSTVRTDYRGVMQPFAVRT